MINANGIKNTAPPKAFPEAECIKYIFPNRNTAIIAEIICTINVAASHITDQSGIFLDTIITFIIPVYIKISPVVSKIAPVVPVLFVIRAMEPSKRSLAAQIR